MSDGPPLSPILAFRGGLAAGCALQIAGGEQRVCASYYIDDNVEVPVIVAARS